VYLLVMGGGVYLLVAGGGVYLLVEGGGVYLLVEGGGVYLLVVVFLLVGAAVVFGVDLIVVVGSGSGLPGNEGMAIEVGRRTVVGG
jgi:hypothetical protein